MTEVNQDGFTRDEISTALSVLNEVADTQIDQPTTQRVRSVRSLVRDYESKSQWRDEQPSDKVDADDYRQLGVLNDGE